MIKIQFVNENKFQMHQARKMDNVTSCIFEWSFLLYIEISYLSGFAIICTIFRNLYL